MSEAERVIVGAINGQRSIAEIVLESRSSSFVVSRVVFTLARGGQVSLIEPGIIEEIRAEVLAPSGEIAALVEKAQASLRSGAFENALRQLKAAQTLEPENEQVRAALRGAEAAIAGELRKSGITAAKVPHLRKTLDEITSMNFSPNEGFILSRINGAWDIGSIIKVSPMREADALLIFHRLHKDGVVELIG
ncbi:MAG: hypothetical protein ACYC9N_12460 [Thermoanaerobaculia bacterium]